LEREGEGYIGNILWISPRQEAVRLLKMVLVVRRFMFDYVSPKDSKGFRKSVRGLAAPLG